MNERADALNKIRALIFEHGMNQEDVFSYKKTKPRNTVAPKYINKETGETWTGRGKPPNWIKDQNREGFLI